MFEIMYLIFLAFVVVIAVAVSIYEIKARRNAENAFWRECEESTAAKEAADRLEGENLSLKEQYNLLHSKNSQLVTDYAVLQVRLEDKRKECKEYQYKIDKYESANKALKTRNFDDIMSFFECTIGEGGKEYYEKDGICLIVEDGKCVGYYRPHGADACEREGYEAPVAQTVEANAEDVAAEEP